jgi:hypothetical protein
MKISRLLIFLISFSIFYLIMISLISLYGLQVCPVLSHAGFLVGCSYWAFYIGCVLIFNYISINFLNQRKRVSSFWSYLVSSILPLVVSQIVYKIQHISSSSRAPEVLALASLLLGLTQASGLSWAFIGKISSAGLSTRNFLQLWRNHMLRVITPIAFALVIWSD